MTYTNSADQSGGSNKMEFEELKIEVPMGDDESDDEKWQSIAKTYENKAGTFVTGFDVNSKEAQERRRKRGKRFGFQLQLANDDEVEKQIEYFSPPEELPEATDGELRTDAVFLYGVENMSTKDVFKYFEEFGPSSVEWIDDVSCNVVWDDNFSASRAMSAKGRIIGSSDDNDEKEESSRLDVWRAGIKFDKAKCLLMRHSTKKDRKQPGAARRSLYYLEHGHPNNRRGTGKKKGIVSGSRKRKILQERERMRHIYSDKPDVVFIEKMDVDDAKPSPGDDNDDDNEPPMKIVVSNDDSSPLKTADGKCRMRMYADDASDDDAGVRSRIRTEVPASGDDDLKDDDDDDDDDGKEERSWRKSPSTAPPTVDLRAKLKNKQILGFDYTNRPSLSIEIKEEGSS